MHDYSNIFRIFKPSRWVLGYISTSESGFFFCAGFTGVRVQVSKFSMFYFMFIVCAHVVKSMDIGHGHPIASHYLVNTISYVVVR